MTLRSWLHQERMRQSAFAKIIDVHPNTISRYVHGDRFPERQIIDRIYEATDGAVCANSWYGHVSLPQAHLSSL